MEHHSTHVEPSLDLALLHAGEISAGERCPLPSGHRLTRARLRHLLRSERLVLTRQGLCVGVAAYQASDGRVRVVHDFLIDRRLSSADTASALNTMLAALEFNAESEHVTSLVVLVEGGMPLQTFFRRGFTALLADAAGAWLRKELPPFDPPFSHHVH